MASKEDFVSGNIDYHETLNPIAWDDSDKLRSEVQLKLLEIARVFVKYLDIPNFEVVDIVLTGSMANYNYTKYSDFDIHVVTHYANLQSDDIAEAFYRAKKEIWNNEHDIKIRGHEAELYVEDSETPPVSGGVYSILRDEWINKPEYDPPRINNTAVNAKVKDLVRQIAHAIKDGDINDIERIRTKIRNMRKSGLAKAGEFGVENLTFKILRNEGYLDKLHKAYLNLQDQELSLEGQINEGASSILYHFSGIRAALNIIQTGEFHLSSVVGTRSEEQYAPEGHPYFLSLTRTRVGDYHRYVGTGGVLFVLDGNWFNHNHKVEPIDYWERGWQHSPGRSREAEDRVFSKTPTLPIDSIQEVHVLLKEQDKWRSPETRALLLAAKRRGLKTYFYVDEANWRLLNKSKSVSPGSASDVLAGQMPTRQLYHPERDYLEPWLELIYKNSKTELGPQAEKTRYNLVYYGRNYPNEDSGLAADLSNARKPDQGQSRKSAIKVIDYMMKNGFKTPLELRNYLVAKWDKIADEDRARAKKESFTPLELAIMEGGHALDEARRNPEQNLRSGSGKYDLINYVEDIRDKDNWAVSMTMEPKLGINPQAAVSEDTPKGIYFYPLRYFMQMAERNEALPWGDNFPYLQLFQYDRSGEMTQQTQVDPAKLKQALLQYCPEEVIDQAIDEPEYDGTPYWTIYDCLSRLGKGDETNVIRWNKVLRDLGFTSVYDNGRGWIAYNEPTQGVILDPRIIKQHKMFSNRNPKLEHKKYDLQGLADSIGWSSYYQQELQRNRIRTWDNPNEEKVRLEVARIMLKQFLGKSGEEAKEMGYVDALKAAADKVVEILKPVKEVSEAFDKPYKLKWEKGDYGDVDAYAKMDDGNYLSIMFNKGYNQDNEEAWSVEFFRNNSQEVTGEGDAQRVFATVLGAIQTFIKKYKPNRIIFSASKEVEQGQNAQSRARLYDSLVQRYARAWGFRSFRADTGNKVIYELNRIKPLPTPKPANESIVTEGGWASTETQDTVITPKIIAEVVRIMHSFEKSYNAWQANNGFDTEIKIGDPKGSGTYYRRDLEQDPGREYGDIDIECFIHSREGVKSAQRITEYKMSITEYCLQSPDFSTENGTNLIMRTTAGAVQVDLLYIYHEHAAWSQVLSPEYRVKGVISTSLTSALAEVLNLSFSSQGIQVKIRNNQPVSFRQSKDTELRTVSLDPENWAKDIYSLYYYLSNGQQPIEFPPNLEAHSGHRGETRLSDIVLSIKALASALEDANLLGHGALISIPTKQDLVRKVATVYSNKLETAENSSKFDKAQTPAAVEKAKKTKLMLAKYRNEITKLLLN